MGHVREGGESLTHSISEAVVEILGGADACLEGGEFASLCCIRRPLPLFHHGIPELADPGVQHALHDFYRLCA